MDWKYFGAGVGFLMMAYFSYWGIQQRKQKPDKYPIDVPSVLDIESWGVVIIGAVLGVASVIKSFS